jgi:ligand-binding sensor domain-containing protein
MHRAKDNVLWMRGNKDGKGLWGLLKDGLSIKAVGVTDVASDDNGEIYVATHDALYKIDNNELVEFFDAGAKYMACDKRGFLWFVPMPPPGVPQVQSNLLIKFNMKTKTYFKLAPVNCPIKGDIRKIVVDNNNVKYILTAEGIYIIDDAPLKDLDWNIITAENNGAEALNENYWEALSKGENGNYVALVQDKKFGLLFFQDNQWTPMETYDKPRGFYEIKDIVKQNEKIYLVTSYGFYRLENDKFEQMKNFDKKQFSDRISAVLKDDENNLWIGSNKGIAKFDGANYTYFNKKNTPELAEESILSICSDRDKRIFFGTTDGLAVLDKNEWAFYDKKSGLDNKKVVAVASNSKGQTFIATASLMKGTGVINVYEEGELRNEPLPENILVTKMLVDKHDNLWIKAHASLVCRKANGEYITYDFKNSPIPKHLVIKNIFLFEDELRVLIDEYVFDKNDGLPQHTKPAELFGMDVNKFQLNTFIPIKQVLIYDIK